MRRNIAEIEAPNKGPIPSQCYARSNITEYRLMRRRLSLGQPLDRSCTICGDGPCPWPEIVFEGTAEEQP